MFAGFDECPAVNNPGLLSPRGAVSSRVAMTRGWLSRRHVLQLVPFDWAVNYLPSVSDYVEAQLTTGEVRWTRRRRKWASVDFPQLLAIWPRYLDIRLHGSNSWFWKLVQFRRHF